MKTSSLFAATLILAQSAWAGLISVDFGANTRFPDHHKTGFAATGITANDYWNFYDADNPDGTWKVNGSLSNLRDAGGLVTSVGIAVSDGSGAWASSSSDAMYYNYIYSLSSGQTSVSVMNLSPGTYNFYLYGGDSSFNLRVGGTDYGTRVSLDLGAPNPPPWMEGTQYVLFSNVQVGFAQQAVISLGPGQTYPQGVIAGMQIQMIPEPSSWLLLGVGALAISASRQRWFGPA